MAATPGLRSLARHFRSLKDPRVVGRSHHRLIDLIVLALCGVIANCDDWPDVVLFAQQREAWFRRFLALPAGIPSHDTFERVFALLDPRTFERCCVAWLKDAAQLANVGHIAIDGKTLTGSSRLGLRGLHLVSAFATAAGVSLGQVAVDKKANEITAIPQLLELLELNGALVTIDAIGCQKSIAAKIVAKGADYVLVAKANQERLMMDIQATVGKALEGELPAAKVHQVTEMAHGHGRQEKRTCIVITDLTDIRDRREWKRLTTVGMCLRERTVNGTTTEEVCYFIGSRRMGARRYGSALRQHWGIENNLHWHLDVSFREDENRVANRHGAENLATMRKLALGLLKAHPRKDSVARKRKLAAIKVEFLGEVLAGADKLDRL
jgi:predicted transposase YbfD/YdcC